MIDHYVIAGRIATRKLYLQGKFAFYEAVDPFTLPPTLWVMTIRNKRDVPTLSTCKRENVMNCLKCTRIYRDEASARLALREEIERRVSLFKQWQTEYSQLLLKHESALRKGFVCDQQ